MSTEAPQGQPAQPKFASAEDAYGLIMREVYIPVFFDKLAQEFGIAPRDEQEAQILLGMALQMEEAHALEQTKQASVRGGLQVAAEELSRTISQQYGLPDASQRQQEQVLDKVAYDLASDPTLAEAMACYQIAQQQQYSAARAA